MRAGSWGYGFFFICNLVLTLGLVKPAGVDFGSIWVGVFPGSVRHGCGFMQFQIGVQGLGKNACKERQRPEALLATCEGLTICRFFRV